MLEIRYDNITKVLSGWCADDTQFGNLERDGHTVVILDIPIPDKPLEAWVYDEATSSLIPNYNYVEPEPPLDYKAEIKDIKKRLNNLEP